MSIPDPLPPVGLGEIPQSVGTLPKDIEAPEAEPYLLSFKYYNNNECELKEAGAIGPYALDCLLQLKSLGTQLHLSDGEGNKVFGIRTERVFNSHGYTNLFKTLYKFEAEGGLVMHEAFLEGKVITTNHRFGKKNKETISKGRFFFFHIKQTLYIVAIRANHYETLKR